VRPGRYLFAKWYSYFSKPIATFTLPLVIVGDSPDASDYARRLKGTSDGRVRFLGYVYGPGVQQLFANCLLYVQPSLMEGNSPALMTAMGHGRAVVASDIEQNVETIGDAGATFVSGDAGSLTHVLTELIGDAREFERLGGLARERIATVYNWDRSTERLDHLYRQVWSGPRNSCQRSSVHDATSLGSACQ